MKDLIVISGAPGSGKTTVSKLLQKRLGFPPLLDFGDIRAFHLDEKCSNQSKEEEKMSFENLLFILRNYFRHGYRNVIVNDLLDFRVKEIPRRFRSYDFLIASLIIENNEELTKRVLGERDSGYRDVSSALEWNRKLMERKLLRNEVRIANTHRSPEKTVQRIVELI